MKKKLILSIIIAIVFSFYINYSYATNMVQDAANTITNSINKTENTMQNAGNAVMDAGNSVMNAANNVVDGAAGAINTITQDRNNNINDKNNTNYTVTRTAGEGTILGMNATTWTWIIMGLIAISIVALVWYYSMQTTDKRYDE